MAKPQKRRVEGEGSARAGNGGVKAEEEGGAGQRRSGASAKGSETTTSRRVTPPKAKRTSAPKRYTAPRPGAGRRPSPRWVPVLMFALWGLGLVVIVLNYMQVLPGTDAGGNGWYLVGGLGAILAGIMVATQYH